MEKVRKVVSYVKEGDYLKLRAMLTLKKKSFSQWLREKISQHIKDN